MKLKLFNMSNEKLWGKNPIWSIFVVCIALLLVIALYLVFDPIFHG